MLSNLSSANNPINENSVIQKAQNDYAEIDQRVDDLETEVAENTAALNQQGAQITSLANQVADVAAKTTFPNINTNRINSAGAGNVTVGSALNVTGNVNAPNATISGSLTVGGTNFNTVRDNATTANANASTALTKANQAVTKANATEAALNEYKDQIANSVSTGTANISGGLTVGETINANDVVSTEGHFGSIETPSIDVKEIKSTGSLELPAQMSTPNDWFTITVPNGITATFSGSYQGKKYKFTVDKGNIEYDQDVLELIKDVSFKRSDNNVRIRVKADEALTYSFTDTGAVEPISIQKSAEAYADYSYAPQKARGTIYKGFDDRTSEIQMPGIFCASVIRADEQEYICSAAECQIISKKLFLPDEWNETGMISCTSGTDNQYVSNATKDGCVSPTWKTPVETAVDGKLSNTHCLITEKAVSEYNGTVDDGTDVTYPITNIGDDACVHGKLTAECLCGTCCVQGKAACFQEDVQADCFNGNCLVICDIYGKAPVGGTSKVVVHDDTEFMNTTTFDENSCFKKKIVVDCDADFGEDVHIAGDLYVNGVSHVVDEETIETPSNEIMLRQNATTGLANTEISGILINKYNGTDSLTVGTDNTGTLRVGTGTGTSTSYATICHNQTENKWYVSDTEVTPAGVLQSYATKVEEDPYTVYTDAVFIAIDKTSLEPVLTRDEEADMTQCGITYWDATNTKAKSASKIKYNNNGLNFDDKTCIEATQTTITDGTDTTTIDATKVESKCGCFTDACVESTLTADVVCACTCVDTPLSVADCVKSRGDGEIAGNFLICGSLSVCGETAITGLMSDCIATTETSVNADYYIPMVEKNHQTQGANTVCTDGAFKYNPFSNTLTAENADFTDTVQISCNCVENECVNNLCIGTVVTNADATKSAVYCVTNVTGNTDFAIPVYNKNVTNVNSTKKAELSYVNQSNGPRYNPNTNTFCVCCVRVAKDVIADEAVATCCVVASMAADLAAGASKNIVLDARCKNSSGTVTSHRTTFCGLDGKIYNDYGVCSTAQLNGLNTPVTSDFYSENTGTGYMYLGHVEGESTANHDVSVSGMIYTYDISNNHASIKEKTNFTAILRGNAGANTIYEAFTDNYSTRLKFTREVKGNKFILRLYYQLASPYNRIIVRIDEVGIGDMGPQVPPASYWKPDGTIVTSMTGTQFYWNLFPNSGTAIANMAYCLCNVGTTNGYAELYYGSLRGVSSICGNISFCDPNGSENYCTIYSLATLAHKCQGLGAYNMGSWLYHQASSSPVGIFNPNMDPNESNFLPDIKSIKNTVTDNVNHYYRVIGYSLAAYEGTGDVYCGPYFALYRPCSYTNSGWCNCIRAVMNWRNCVCRNCTTQAGTWICDSMIELIDSQGGQTIEHNIRIHDSTNADITSANVNPKIIFNNSDCNQNGCLVFTEYDTYLSGASLTFATDQPASWFCSQYVKSATDVTCSLRLYHCATSTDWQNLACVSFGAEASGGTTHCAFLWAACPDAYGINIAFGQNNQTIIYAGESAQDNFANFITQNGDGEKVVLASDSNAADIVLNMNGGITCAYKHCFTANNIITFKWDTTLSTPAYSRCGRLVMDNCVAILESGGVVNSINTTCAFVIGNANTVKANCAYVFGCGNTNGAPSTAPSNVIMIGTGNNLSYNNISRTNMVAIGFCNYDCQTSSGSSIAIGNCNINSGDGGISIGWGGKAANYAVTIGVFSSSSKYYTSAASAIRIGASTSTSTAGTCSIGIGQDAVAGGSRSVGIGHLSCAAQASVAIGACSNALTGNSVAIGTCSCSQTYAVAIGCDAKATYYSVSIGCAAVSCNSYGTAIGHGAKNRVQSGIAIGDGANTSAYSSACVLVDERAGSRMRRSIICWNGGTKQCDLFCAIYCRFNFNYYDDSSTVYISVNGAYGYDSLNEIRWNKNGTPKNFDIGRQGFTNAITVYDGCTCAIPKAGYVQIVGYAR